jgi:hypothetical protein
LIQVKASGTGLAVRGAQVTLHDHFDGTRVLRWRNRKCTYTILTKEQIKTAEADGKTINARATPGENCTLASPPPIANPLSNNTDDEGRINNYLLIYDEIC